MRFRRIITLKVCNNSERYVIINWDLIVMLIIKVDSIMCNEKLKDLFSKDIYQLPIRWDGSDFYSTIYNLFKIYLKDIDTIFSNTDKTYTDVEFICRKICEAVNYSFMGYPAESFKSFQEVMKYLDSEPLLVEIDNLKNVNLYRVVDNGNAAVPKRKRIFHVPFNMRSKMSTQRYSIPGFPSLYLGTSIELCCMELGKKVKDDFLCVSRFEIDWDNMYEKLLHDMNQKPTFDNGQFKIYDLSLKPNEIINKYSEEDFIKYMKWYPVISTCSYIRAMRDDPYSPEYIIPQLFIQWVRSENENAVVGIKYFSCVSKYSSNLGNNFVFPSTGIQYNVRKAFTDYCSRLSHRFKLTEPRFIKDYDDFSEIKKVLDKDNELDFIEDYDIGEDNDIKGHYNVVEGVSGIGNFSFYNCEEMTSILIPESVTYIDDRAFSGCIGLTEINIPSSVNKIGECVFFRCENLKKINVDSKNQYYADIDGVLYNKEKTQLIYFPPGRLLYDFKISNGIEKVNANAFVSCILLKSIYIPKSVNFIGEDAFSCCLSLLNINVDPSNCHYKDIDGILCNINKTEIICYPAGRQSSRFKIPKGISLIRPYAFQSCLYLISVEIPSSVSSIGEGAFYNCHNLKTVNIKKGVTHINDFAFFNCENLINIEIPNSLRQIGIAIFYGCKNLTSVNIENGVTMIGAFQFRGCEKLTKLKIPDSVKLIRAGAFINCKKITKIDIPKSVESIESQTFEGCITLDEIDIPNGVKYIHDGAFKECKNLTKIDIPDSVKLIARHSFEGCEKLKDVKLHNIGYIGDSAFKGCKSLIEFIIPQSIFFIGTTVFLACESLKKITVDKDNYNYSDANGVLYNKEKTRLICYPLGKKEKSFMIPNEVQYIEQSAFETCNSLESVFIPDSVLEVKENAFASCKNLSVVNINQNTIFSKDAFSNCSDKLEFHWRV